LWLSLKRPNPKQLADEIILSRAGKRVRVVNTDAEGRMAMADVLCQAKEEALAGAVNPRLLTIATLTGHAVRCVGEGYSIVMVNDPAQEAGVAQRLQAAGDKLADPFEYSTVRREDWTMITPKYATEDVVGLLPLAAQPPPHTQNTHIKASRALQIQCNTAASSATARGHQFPAAFLMSYPPPSPRPHCPRGFARVALVARMHVHTHAFSRIGAQVCLRPRQTHAQQRTPDRLRPSGHCSRGAVAPEEAQWRSRRRFARRVCGPVKFTSQPCVFRAIIREFWCCHPKVE